MTDANFPTSNPEEPNPPAWEVRLSRIEGILATVADSQQRSQQRHDQEMAEIRTSQQASAERLDRVEDTLNRSQQASAERLDRIEDTLNRSQQASAERLDRIEDTLNRNAAQQAENSIAIRELRQSIRDGYAETRQEIKANIDDVSAMIFEGLSETKKITDSNARAIQAWESRIQESTEDAQEIASSMVVGFGQRIEEGIGNLLVIVGNIARQQEALAHQQQETDQRFNNLLAEARADRQQAQADREQAQADREQAQADREQWQLQAQANETEHRAFRQNIQVLLAEIARLWQRIAS